MKQRLSEFNDQQAGGEWKVQFVVITGHGFITFPEKEALLVYQSDEISE
jgi:hypothetical protein